MITRVALYIRVSTEEQVLHGYSIQAQEDALLEYAAQHQLRVVGIYRDEGHSARKPVGQRPEMQRLLRDVEAGKLDKILFIKLDRWFRNVAEYHKVQEVLTAHHVSWQAILEDYDTSTAAGMLSVNIMLSVAQNEADRTSERIRFVLDGKRQRKEWCFSGGRWPLGYAPVMVDGVKRCGKDPETEDLVSDFWGWVLAYGSVRRAGALCNEKYGLSRTYRAWMLLARNELYTGTFRGVCDYCPSYVSRSDWERIIRKHEICKTAQQGRIYLFTGLIRCPVCGSVMSATYRAGKNGAEYHSYRCCNSAVGPCTCRQQISEKKVEAWLLDHIREELEQFVVDAEIAEKKKAAGPRVQDVVTLSERLRRLNVIYLSGSMSDEEYSAEAARLNAALVQAREAAAAPPPDLAPLRDLLATDFEEIYKSLPPEDRRRLWRSIISEIRIADHAVTGVKLRIL